MCELQKDVNKLMSEVTEMQEERKMEKRASIIYQFVVLFSVIALNVLVFLRTGVLNDILVGALIGVMVGLAPSGSSIKATNSKKEEDQ